MMNHQPPPLVFISHKHVDNKIAEVIRSFITMQSGGRVSVFQSSSPWADAPKIGRNLNKQLIDTLWHTSILILVYTTAEQDWSYCMWESGVALHPQSPDTKIILFQCANTSPLVFADQVNVNARNLVDIQKFTNEFLTAPDFFPGSDEPITKFLPNGQEVASAAADLFQKLTPVLPIEEPPIEWPAYPFLQFELELGYANSIRNLIAEDRSKLVQQECFIVGADKHCEQLFGVPSFPSGMTFKQLADNWTAKHSESQSRWVEALSIQISAGAMWEFPPTIWEYMQGFGNGASYAPVLTRVRKMPGRGCMQFDVYFYKFDVPVGTKGTLSQLQKR
jgi:hypothetical protein